MEFSDDQRHVGPAVEFEVGNVEMINVVAHNITILGSRGSGAGIDRGEAAPEVQLAGRDGFDDLAHSAEVLLGGMGVEGGKIAAGLGVVRRLAALQQGIPSGVVGAPGLVQLLYIGVFGLEVGNEDLLGSLLWWGLQGGERQGRIVAPGHFIVREVANAPGVSRAVVPLTFHGTAQAVGKALVEYIGELAPIAFAAFDRFGASGADAIGIGCKPEPIG